MNTCLTRNHHGHAHHETQHFLTRSMHEHALHTILVQPPFSASVFGSFWLGDRARAHVLCDRISVTKSINTVESIGVGFRGALSVNRSRARKLLIQISGGRLPQSIHWRTDRWSSRSTYLSQPHRNCSTPSLHQEFMEQQEARLGWTDGSASCTPSKMSEHRSRSIPIQCIQSNAPRGSSSQKISSS